MKRSFSIICFIMIFTVVSVKSQNSIAEFLPLKSSKVEFLDVIEEKGTSPEILGDKASQWMKDQKIQNLERSYPDEKKIAIKGQWSMQLLWGPNNFKELYKTVKCHVEIIAKKDRYQYRFSDFIVQEPGREIELEIYKSDQKKQSRYNEEFYKRIDTEVKNLIEDLSQRMRRPL